MATGMGAQQEAVARRCGTSLAVTVINASAGLIAHWGTAQLDWGLTTTSAIATVGAAFPAVDTVTLVGYMTNNCILASAVEGEGLEPTSVARVEAFPTARVRTSSETSTSIPATTGPPAASQLLLE